MTEPACEANKIEHLKTHLFLKCDKTMQNQLLAELLTKETGFTATCGQNFCVLRPKQRENRYLLLIDCHSLDPQEIWSKSAKISIHNNLNYQMALFNVHCSMAAALEKDAMARGIRGIFTDDQPMEVLVKGIKSITAGEFWYTRRAMSRFLEKNLSGSPYPVNVHDNLTKRESQILTLIAGGLSNTEIADHLHLSIHTVKTHIYNLYKKINVPNRLQAVFWAAQNLPNL
jgi:ATP/maltotriose-dependent transcriptional regulator MalT